MAVGAVALAITAVVGVVAFVGDDDDGLTLRERNERIINDARAEVAFEARILSRLDRELALRRRRGLPDAFRIPGGWCLVEVVLSGDEVALYATGPEVVVSPDGDFAVEIAALGGNDEVACREAASAAALAP